MVIRVTVKGSKTDKIFVIIPLLSVNWESGEKFRGLCLNTAWLVWQLQTVIVWPKKEDKDAE